MHHSSLLTIIKNSLASKKQTCHIKTFKNLIPILNVLKEEGFIYGYKKNINLTTTVFLKLNILSCYKIKNMKFLLNKKFLNFSNKKKYLKKTVLVGSTHLGVHSQKSKVCLKRPLYYFS